MKWMNVWSYNQMDYRSWPSEIGNCIQEIRVRSNNLAERVRIRFSNLYGIEPIVLTSAVLKIGGNEYLLTRGGNSGISLMPGEECSSDAVNAPVSPGDKITISVSVKARTLLTGGLVTYSRRELEITHRDAVSGELIDPGEVFSMVKDNNRMCFAFGVSGIDFYSSEQERYIVVFGDSLTGQGFWVDHLKQQLRENGKTGIAVINRGIGGNRILKGTSPLADPYERHGRSGVERFEQDCFGDGNPDLILVFHGINDLITRHAEPTDYTAGVDEIISGLKEYAQIAHAHGSKIWIGTLAPLKHSVFYNEALEHERLILNQWIRSQSDFDKVLEFEQAVCDTADMSALYKNYDSGDGLHFSDEGGRAVAACIDLNYLLYEN